MTEFAYGLAVIAAGLALWAICRVYAAWVTPLDADHLYAQMKKVWASPVIRVRVSR